MNNHQREIAELLRGLKRPAEAIAVNSGIPLEVITAWLKSGQWPGLGKQQTLFDVAGENPPREMPKPAIAARGESGLRQFSSDSAGRPDTMRHPGRSELDA